MEQKTIYGQSSEPATGMKLFEVTNIVWDTDGEKIDLPTTYLVYAEEEDEVVDLLSDDTGWCIESLSIVEWKNYKNKDGSVSDIQGMAR